MLLILMLHTSLFANSDKSYFEDKERGWFWGEEPKKNKIPPKKEKQNYITVNGKEYKLIDNKTSIPWAIIDKLDPDEIAKLETETKKISVMFPTEQNIMEYKRLQKFIMDKSIGFTDNSHFVNKQNPEQAKWIYDTSMSSKLRIDAKREDRWTKQDIEINKHKENIIILVATLPTCSFCKRQMPLLERFEQEYGVIFEEIDLTIYPEFGRKYQVERTPDLFLMYKEPNKSTPLFTRFGSGLHTIEDLKKGVLESLYTFKKIEKDLLEY